MKSHKIVAALLAILLHQTVAFSRTVDCNEVKHFKSGALRESHASLRFNNTVVESFFYNGVMASGKVGEAYFCDLEINRKDKNSKWLADEQKISIWLKGAIDNDEPSIEITTKEGQTIFIFNVSPTEYCGFGAEFPSKMIRSQKGKCTATY